MSHRNPERRERRKPGSSLRTEFLFYLAFLAAAALLLALFTARVLDRSVSTALAPAGVVVGVVVVFVLLVDNLLKRWMLKPLDRIGQSAEAIASGDYELRVPEEGPAEIASVARVLNLLTDQLLQNQGRLAENVRSLDETNQRLTDAHRELVQSEKLASLGQLAAGVAHEIGNPLGAMLGYISLLKRRGGETEILEGLDREARRIDRIVRGLLDYARPTSSHREPLDVNGSVYRVLELLRGQGWLAEVDVRLDFGPDLPPVMGDPHRLDQVFVNLLRNAETAMEGKGKVTIMTRVERYSPDRPAPVRRADDPPGVNYSHLRRALGGSVRAAPTLERNREVVRIVVIDSGPGIPDDRLGSVFDPFFTTKRLGEGTGLGLAIVAGTVADLGGRVEVSSSQAGGATFNVWLPTVVKAE
ncbi:MAG: HAMP domain-containing protein [Gemmatimonas sp.]|nr:HAMP domain-containing protein [Gemmatimonas sp.]